MFKNFYSSFLSFAIKSPTLSKTSKYFRMPYSTNFFYFFEFSMSKFCLRSSSLKKLTSFLEIFSFDRKSFYSSFPNCILSERRRQSFYNSLPHEVTFYIPRGRIPPLKMFLSARILRTDLTMCSLPSPN